MFAGMNTHHGRLFADYTPAELELLADFLRRTADAGRNATDNSSTTDGQPGHGAHDVAAAHRVQPRGREECRTSAAQTPEAGREDLVMGGGPLHSHALRLSPSPVRRRAHGQPGHRVVVDLQVVPPALNRRRRPHWGSGPSGCARGAPPRVLSRDTRLACCSGTPPAAPRPSRGTGQRPIRHRQHPRPPHRRPARRLRGQPAAHREPRQLRETPATHDCAAGGRRTTR